MIDINLIKNKKVLIMGGAGFIGHNLALKLKEYGAEPFIVDGLQVNNLGYYISQSENSNSVLYISFINERIKILRKNKINVNIFDIREYNLVSQYISKVRPDFVIHLAAISHANRSNKDPFSTFDHSLRTLENVLDTLKNFKTHLIYFSSSMVYGHFKNKFATEEDHCNPLGIYGALKYGAEKLVIAYGQVFEVPYTIIRPSALYGERCVSRRVGQALIENAISGKDLTINGDGEEELDFTYIDDLIQGIVKCLISDKSRNEIFNITYGEGRKLNELAKIITDSFPGSKLVFRPRDNLMPIRGTLSIDKARNKIGFEPKYNIEKGLVKYINWYKEFASKNSNLFK